MVVGGIVVVVVVVSLKFIQYTSCDIDKLVDKDHNITQHWRMQHPKP